MDENILKQRARAFDYLFDAIVVTDLEGKIIDWNKGSETLYGYSREEVIGQSVSILHVPEDIEHVTAEVISSVQKFGKWSGEVRSLHKDGHIGWIESICVPIFDDDNKMTGALGINRDISARKNEAEHLNHLAHYDPLTDIPNRHLLLDRIAHLSAQSDRNKAAFALLYIDLDKFKDINDTHGHLIGDHILKDTAQRLSQCIRQSDTIARIGGDEFVILLEGIITRENISMMAQKFIEQFNQPFEENNKLFNLSCSIGIATYPQDGLEAETLLIAADKAMYKAKQKGRGCYEFFSMIEPG